MAVNSDIDSRLFLKSNCYSFFDKFWVCFCYESQSV